MCPGLAMDRSIFSSRSLFLSLYCNVYVAAHLQSITIAIEWIPIPVSTPPLLLNSSSSSLLSLSIFHEDFSLSLSLFLLGSFPMEWNEGGRNDGWQSSSSSSSSSRSDPVNTFERQGPANMANNKPLMSSLVQQGEWEESSIDSCGSLLFIPMHINLLTGCKAFAIASTREAQEEGLCASLPRSHPPSLLLLLPNSIQFNSIDKIGYLVWCELELYRCSTAVIWISLTCRCLTRGQGWTRIDQTNHYYSSSSSSIATIYVTFATSRRYSI